MEFAEYELESVLYEGSETRVYRAVHLPSGARVAIKVPRAEVPNPRVTGRLVHEYQVLRQLVTVPGVSRVRALEKQDGAVALVLENPGYRSLDRVLDQQGRLSVVAGLRLGLGLARVLEGVHAAGVMHKDVKPQNLLVDDAMEQVVLLDFGIASLLSQEATEASIPEALEGTDQDISDAATGKGRQEGAVAASEVDAPMGNYRCVGRRSGRLATSALQLNWMLRLARLFCLLWSALGGRFVVTALLGVCAH